MSLCIPAYSLADGMIALGMNWWHVLVIILLGSVSGICTSLVRFKGAHIPAMARALIAAGWFGINCWIGTTTIDGLMQVAFEGWRTVPGHTAMDFLFFWGLNMLIAYKGPEIIKNLMRISAPLLMIAVLGLFAWALVAAGG